MHRLNKQNHKSLKLFKVEDAFDLTSTNWIEDHEMDVESHKLNKRGSRISARRHNNSGRNYTVTSPILPKDNEDDVDAILESLYDDDL